MTTLQLPTDPGRVDPIYKPATKPASHPEKAAAFIFVHGLADSAEAIQSKRSFATIDYTCLTRTQMWPTSSNKAANCPI